MHVYKNPIFVDWECGLRWLNLHTTCTCVWILTCMWICKWTYSKCVWICMWTLLRTYHPNAEFTHMHEIILTYTYLSRPVNTHMQCTVDYLTHEQKHEFEKCTWTMNRHIIVCKLPKRTLNWYKMVSVIDSTKRPDATTMTLLERRG